jgi:hypothetical protein
VKWAIYWYESGSDFLASFDGKKFVGVLIIVSSLVVSFYTYPKNEKGFSGLAVKIHKAMVIIAVLVMIAFTTIFLTLPDRVTKLYFLTHENVNPPNSKSMSRENLFVKFVSNKSISELNQLASFNRHLYIFVLNDEFDEISKNLINTSELYSFIEYHGMADLDVLDLSGPRLSEEMEIGLLNNHSEPKNVMVFFQRKYINIEKEISKAILDRVGYEYDSYVLHEKYDIKSIHDNLKESKVQCAIFLADTVTSRNIKDELDVNLSPEIVFPDWVLGKYLGKTDFADLNNGNVFILSTGGYLQFMEGDYDIWLSLINEIYNSVNAYTKREDMVDVLDNWVEQTMDLKTGVQRRYIQ